MEEEPKIRVDTFDYQMEYIKNHIWKNRQRIREADNTIAEVTYVMYEHVVEYIIQIVDQKYLKNHKIMLIGGI